MYHYGQYCPVARASEILADRWTPLIVRELLAGIRHFNDLDRGLPGILRGLLVERLRQLEQMDVVERHVHPGRQAVEYSLTRAGRDLQRVIDVLGGWGSRWAFGDPRPTELDPIVLLWWMRRRSTGIASLLDAWWSSSTSVVDGRAATGSSWSGPTCRCASHPKFEIDVRVVADIDGFYRVRLGRITLDRTVREGLVQLHGMPAVVREFPQWFAWSPMADRVRAAASADSARVPAPR